MSIFVMASFAAFWAGSNAVKPGREVSAEIRPYRYHGWPKLLILIGCAYFAIFAINTMMEYGADSISTVISRILSPGEAYKSKFDVYKEFQHLDRVSFVGQILILLSFIYACFIPLLVSMWDEIPRKIKYIALSALGLYILSFLFIGTMKGIADVFIFVVAGGAVYFAKKRLRGYDTNLPRHRKKRTRVIFPIILFASAILTYMVISQIKRAEEFNIIESPIIGDVSNSFIGQIFGNQIAYGVYTVLSYPSHGYLGLSHNLGQDFEFSYGAGIAPSFESYRYQYLGGADNNQLTYPFRTEAATGWPAGMYWATIFPWLASDLSFFLIPPFMFLLGYWFNRVWTSCLVGNSVLSLTALGQFFLFIAFIPANNQVLMSRTGLWTLFTLFALWVAKHLFLKRHA